MIYDLRHKTRYVYGDAVSVSHHTLRLTPREFERQHRQKNDLEIEPAPITRNDAVDYFGNTRTFLTIEGMHNSFAVESISRVTVDPVDLPAPEKTPAWETARDAVFSLGDELDPTVCEFTFDSPSVRRNADLTRYASKSFPAGRSVLDAALDLTRRIHADFAFDPKATTVSTPIAEVFRLRRGVCQDFAHLAIGCLRGLGIASRYVSGYLETTPPPGAAKLVGADMSHAWVSFYCPNAGWIDLDPTNNLVVSDRHIVAAWGRDYGDVSPVSGVIVGAGDHSLSVSVDVTRVD